MPLLHPKKQARAAAGTGKNPAGRYNRRGGEKNAAASSLRRARAQ